MVENTSTVSFEDIMASLDKETAGQLRLGSTINRQIVPTASFRLNRLLGGGLRKGKQHTFWGGEQSAKTGFALQTVGVNQKLGAKVAWIDAEHSFDPDWAYRLGVDPDRVAVSEVSTISDLTDLQVKMVRLGFDIIVIDSTGALMPKSFIDKDGTYKNFAETGQLGQMAKDLGQMCKMVQGINYDTAVIHISQARVDVGSAAQTKPFKPIGGKEVEHTDSLRVRFSSTKATDKQIMGQVQRGQQIVSERIGFPVTWKIDKNKINGRYDTGDYDFYIGGDFVGLDKERELIEEAVKYGLIEDKTWIEYNGGKWQGKKNAAVAFREDPIMFEKLTIELDSLPV